MADESKKQANAAELTDAYESAWAIMLNGFELDANKWQKSMETLFLSFDKNGNGDIDIAELGAGMKIYNIQMSPMQLNAFREGLDKEDNGKVSFSEFMDAAESAALRQTKRVDPVKVRQEANERVKHHNSIKEESVKAQSLVEIALKKEAEANTMTPKDQSEADDAAEARGKAWNTLLKDMDSDPVKWQPKLEKMFRSFKDGADEVDIHELGAGLKKCGIHMSPMQLNAFRESIDEDDDGFVSLNEFMTAARWEMKKLIEKKGSFKGSKPSTPTAAAAATKRTSKVATRAGSITKKAPKLSSSKPKLSSDAASVSSPKSKTKKKPTLSSDSTDSKIDSNIKGRGSYL